MEFSNLRLVRGSKPVDEQNDDPARFRFPSQGHLPLPTQNAIIESGIRKLMDSIHEQKLDLGSCLLKGGALRTAALRTLGIIPEGRSPGKLIEVALADLSRPIEEIPLLDALSRQGAEWRNTIVLLRHAISNSDGDIRHDPILGSLYTALVSDEEIPERRGESSAVPTFRFTDYQVK